MLPIAITLSSTILGGGMFLGINVDKIAVLCQEMDDLKSDHFLLKEKVYDIHNKVCLIDQKLSTILEK
tara:strand:- start:418 stop:621 length:204 start_codon:yes stop_codon:yes gene_type:complete